MVRLAPNGSMDMPTVAARLRERERMEALLWSNEGGRNRLHVNGTIADYGICPGFPPCRVWAITASANTAVRP